MANERETVSLQGMIRWALAECAAREIDALPDIQELNALYPDTAAFRRRVFSAIGKWKKQEKHRPLRVLKHIIVAAAVLVSVLFGTLMVNASVRTAVVNTIIEWTERAIGVQFEVFHLPNRFLLEESRCFFLWVRKGGWNWKSEY